MADFLQPVAVFVRGEVGVEPEDEEEFVEFSEYATVTLERGVDVPHLFFQFWVCFDEGGERDFRHLLRVILCCHWEGGALSDEIEQRGVDPLCQRGLRAVLLKDEHPCHDEDEDAETGRDPRRIKAKYGSEVGFKECWDTGGDQADTQRQKDRCNRDVFDIPDLFPRFLRCREILEFPGWLTILTHTRLSAHWFHQGK